MLIYGLLVFALEFLPLGGVNPKEAAEYLGTVSPVLLQGMYRLAYACTGSQRANDRRSCAVWATLYVQWPMLSMTAETHLGHAAST